MPFDLIRGLLITDTEKYAQYRAEIAPLLEEAGGAFRYDFEIARTLKSAAGHDISRVFALRFPDRATKDRFFADPRYLEIRKRLFEPSVKEAATIADCGD